MKKKSLFVSLIILGLICFSFLNDNSTKACDINTVTCTKSVKKEVKDIPLEYDENAEPVLFYLINPFMSL